jgi:lipopolysaccharide export system protein LptC
MTAKIVIALLIAAIIAGSFLIGQQGGAPQDAATGEQTAEPDPGYAARDAEVIETGADGRELYRLNAELIRQDPKSGVVELESIAMNYRTETQALWNVKAQRGKVLQEGDVIELDGKVRVTGPMPDTSRTIQLETERLTFETRADRILTDAPVLMSWTGQRMAAVGLDANLKDETVQLKSRVNGRFIP